MLKCNNLWRKVKISATELHSQLGADSVSTLTFAVSWITNLMVSLMNVKAPTKFRSPNTHFKTGLTGITSNLIADPHPTPPLHVCVCVKLLLVTLQK